jgi:hypothetical protein
MSGVEDQALDVEGRVMFSGSPEEVIGWMWSRSSQDDPVVYVRVGNTGRVVPASDHLKYAELRGFEKPGDRSVMVSAVVEILSEFTQEQANSMNQAELTAAYEQTAEKIVDLFREKK